MSASHIELLYCSPSAVDAALFSRYENLLSAEELQRLRSFRSPSAAKEFLIGRALLRTALATRLQCEPSELQFAKNADGKPVLMHPSSSWQFNLSHSHDWVALALCEDGSVGIDVESYARRNNLRAIARRFFSDEENSRLNQCTATGWLDQFFAIWTLKEAHAKALGCGLPKILSCSSIAVDLSARSIDMTLTDAAVTPHNISSWLYRLDENSVLALIAHGEKFETPQILRCIPLRLIEPMPLITHAVGRTQHT